MKEVKPVWKCNTRVSKCSAIRQVKVLEFSVTKMHEHNGASLPRYPTLLRGPVINLHKVTL